MQPKRIRFDIETDTGGDYQAVSGPTGGLVLQMRFEPDTGTPLDTGADLKLEAVNADGEGFTIAHFENIGSLASWTRVPRVGTYDTGGDAISGGDQFPVMAAGDQLRLTVTQSAGVTGGGTGKLFVWMGW